MSREIKAGDKVIAVRDFTDRAGRGRLTAGREYTLGAVRESFLTIKACDAGYRSHWDRTKSDPYFRLADSKPEIGFAVGDTVASSANLGHTYVVLATDQDGGTCDVKHTKNGFVYRGESLSLFRLVKKEEPVLFRLPGADDVEYQLLDDATRKELSPGDRVLVEIEVRDSVIRKLAEGTSYCSPAIAVRKREPKKAIEAGDTVRILGVLNVTGKALCRMTDGRWAVEYDAGDTLGVTPYDESCLEVAS